MIAVNAELKAEISRLRQAFRPKDLSPSVFPKDLDIIDFAPRERLRVRQSHQPIMAPLNALVIFLFAGSLLGYVLGVGIGLVFLALAILFWLLWRGVHVSIDLDRGRYRIVGYTSGKFFYHAPDIEIRTEPKWGKWKCTLYIGDLEVIERTSHEQRIDSDLEEFSRALKHQLGLPVMVEIARGVFLTVDH